MVKTKSIFQSSKLNMLIFGITLVVFGLQIKFRFLGVDGHAAQRVIDGDGKGYYAYLPAVFIYKDLTFSFFDKMPDSFDLQYSTTFLLNHHKKNVNKYTCGEALLLVPFFAIAVLVSYVLGLPVDGYNVIFHIMVAIGALFYLLVGLLAIKNLLRLYKISFGVIGMTVFGMVFGTNLLNYVVNECSMTHVFSFGLISFNIWQVKKLHEDSSRYNWLLCGLSLGLIILIRPVNLLLIASYPFLMAENFRFSFFKSKIWHFSFAVLAVLSVISIQSILWKIEAGDFLIYGYKNEGFDLQHLPHFFDFLFSFERGAFIYSPALILALPGFWYMGRNKAKVSRLLLFLIVLVSIQSAWWCWYYGDGFGERPLIDYYAFFSIPIAYLLAAKRPLVKTISRFLLVIFSFLGVIFCYQYFYWIIYPTSMNFNKFKTVFLKTGRESRELFNSEPEDFYHPHGIQCIDSVNFIFSGAGVVQDKRLTFNPKQIKEGAFLEASDRWPFCFEVHCDSTWIFKTRYAEVSLFYFQTFPDSAASGSLIYVTNTHIGGKQYYCNSTKLQERMNNSYGVWKHFFGRIGIREPEIKGDYIRVFLDNTKLRHLKIRNLKVRIVEARL